MKIEELQAMWEQDCEIDSHNLDDEALKTLRLHAKYVRLLVDAKLKVSAYNLQYNEKRQLRFRYYRGELSKDELVENGWEQYQGIKPISSAMEELLKGDDILTKIAIKKEYSETMVFLLEQIMSGVKSRGWDIKNAIEFKKFLAGN